MSFVRGKKCHTIHFDQMIILGIYVIGMRQVLTQENGM